MKRIAKGLLVVALILAGLYIWLIFQLDWQNISSKKSPSGEMVAYYLMSTSEAGEAPYGDHLILAPGYWPLGQYYGEVFFAGYCTGGLQYRWIDEHQLYIVCNAEKVMKKIEIFKDIHIRYETTTTTLHSSSAHLRDIILSAHEAKSVERYYYKNNGLRGVTKITNYEGGCKHFPRC